MSVLNWMDIIYPADTALFSGYLVAKLSYLLIVRRSLVIVSQQMITLIQWILIFDCLLIVTELVVLYLLGKTTGRNPPLNIDEYRIYVTVTRGVMGVVLNWKVGSSLISQVLNRAKPYHHHCHLPVRLCWITISLRNKSWIGLP